MTMDADEQCHFDLVPPDGEIGVVGIDALLRIDLGVLRTIVRHGNDHHVRNLGGEFQQRLSFGDPFRMPGPAIQGTGKDRGVFPGEELSGRFGDHVILRRMASIQQPESGVGMSDADLHG